MGADPHRAGLGGEPADGGGAGAARAGARAWGGEPARYPRIAGAAAALACGLGWPGKPTSWSFTARRKASRLPRWRVCGGRSLSNTSAGRPSATLATKSNCARKRCALKRCSAAGSSEARSITESHGGGRRWFSTVNFAHGDRAAGRAHARIVPGRDDTAGGVRAEVRQLFADRAVHAATSGQASGRGAISGAGAGRGRRLT